MNLIFFTHPSFLLSQSMPRFASMLTEGMKLRGHNVETWYPQPKFYTIPVPSSLKKWMGYLDQYFLFPKQIRKKLRSITPDTLFVFTDHALGPWVPLVKDQHHIIHCHDFLAQRSALGEIPENPTGWSGKKYQAYIRKGYQQGKNFISVSHQTQKDLHRFLPCPPRISKVVYNGMNKNITSIHAHPARKMLEDQTGISLSSGYILHIGGNQWYKNRNGVIDIYTSWREMSANPLPLLMVGSAPAKTLEAARSRSCFKDDIFFLSGKDDAFVKAAYSGASVFLYPSLAEGFGWPVAEAMAASCPVITTSEAPMNEVGGNAAFYISKMPMEADKHKEWSVQAAETLQYVTQLNEKERDAVNRAGLLNVERFRTEDALQNIEAIYLQVLQQVNKLSINLF